MWLSHSVADEQQALPSGGLTMVRAHSTGSTAHRRHHIHAPDVVPLRRKGKLSPRHVGDHRPGRAPCAFTHSGCTNAPFPAESQTAKRTQAFPAASKGISKRMEPRGRPVRLGVRQHDVRELLVE